jgi:dTMP kinase
MLVNAMNKTERNTILVREPGGTIISEEIRQILLHRHISNISNRTEALLMTGSRAQLTYEVIMPKLIKGQNVIADRFYDSTLAYQGGGRNLDLDWLIKLNHFATYDLEPDVTFLIDILPEEASKRKSKEGDRIERAGIELQTLVRDTYLELSIRFKERIVVIDGHDTIENIHSLIIEELKRKQIIQ